MAEMKFDTALVTGASAGLGGEYARQLASRCGRIVLVARRAELLEKLAQEIRAAAPQVDVHVVAADLSDPGERLLVIEGLLLRGLVPDLLVNNAGLGDYGEFATAQWDRIEAILRVNIEALTHLTHALLPGMLRGGRGAIINVSSLASTVPVPDIAVYAASKAYVSSFSEALRLELRGSGIPVLAVCPGPVSTEFGKVAARDERPGSRPPTHKWFYLDKSRVVAESFDALQRDRARLFPGLRVAAVAALAGLLPLCAIRALMSLRPRRPE